MKNILESIHSLLVSTDNIRESVGGRVFAWGDDGDAGDFGAKFPIITHTDLSTSPHTRALGFFESSYQVSAWSASRLDGKKIIQAIISRLDGYQNPKKGIFRVFFHSEHTSYDAITKTHGEHARFTIFFKNIS